MSTVYLVKIPIPIGPYDIHYFKTKDVADAFIKGLRYADYPFMPDDPQEIRTPTNIQYWCRSYNVNLLRRTAWLEFTDCNFEINDKLEITWFSDLNPELVYILFTDQEGKEQDSFRWTIRLDSWKNAGECLLYKPSLIFKYFRFSYIGTLYSPVSGLVKVKFAQDTTT